jgi:hypothetical protein
MSERTAANGWYPKLAWELALNFVLASGASGTVGEVTKRIADMAHHFACEIERGQRV